MDISNGSTASKSLGIYHVDSGRAPDAKAQRSLFARGWLGCASASERVQYVCLPQRAGPRRLSALAVDCHSLDRLLRISAMIVTDNTLRR